MITHLKQFNSWENTKAEVGQISRSMYIRALCRRPGNLLFFPFFLLRFSRATYLKGGEAEKREMGAVHRTLMLLAGVYAQFFMRLYRVAWLTGMVEWVTTRIARVARLGAGGRLCVPRTGNPNANAKALVLYEYMVAFVLSA